jgi:hypothetical protein
MTGATIFSSCLQINELRAVIASEAETVADRFPPANRRAFPGERTLSYKPDVFADVLNALVRIVVPCSCNSPVAELNRK